MVLLATIIGSLSTALAVYVAIALANGCEILSGGTVATALIVSCPF